MVEIRKAEAADAEKLLEYCRQIGGETDNLTFGSEGISMTVEQETAYLEGIYNSCKQIYLIAVEDGEMVGSAQFSGFVKPRLAHRGEISISVRKAFWGKGIGSRLMEELIRFARDVAKVEMISLEVRSDNVRAIGLYEKFGFQKTGTFRGFMKIRGEEIDCDTMCLRL